MASLKTLSYFLLISSFGYAKALGDAKLEQIQSILSEVGSQCIKDHPLTPDDVIAIKEKKVPEGENSGCFMSCIFQTIGITDEAGKLSAELAKEHAKKVFDDEDELKYIEDVINKCTKVNEEDIGEDDKGCQRAKLVFSCINENASELWAKMDI